MSFVMLLLNKNFLIRDLINVVSVFIISFPAAVYNLDTSSLDLEVLQQIYEVVS